MIPVFSSEARPIKAVRSALITTNRAAREHTAERKRVPRSAVSTRRQRHSRISPILLNRDGKGRSWVALLCLSDLIFEQAWLQIAPGCRALGGRAAVVVQGRKERQLACLPGSGGIQLRAPQFKNVQGSNRFTAFSISPIRKLNSTD
jgi:hypothetical protein